MPNWCENELTIVGDEAELDALEATLRGRDDEGEELPLSFASLDPTPAEFDTLPYGESDEGRELLARFEALREDALREDDPTAAAAAVEFLRENPAVPLLQLERDCPILVRTQHGGWYAWNVQHWGTKCEPLAAEVKREPRCLRYRLSTAWSPPVPFVRTLAARHPSLTATLVWVEAGDPFAGVVQFEKGEIAWRRDERGSTWVRALLEVHWPEWADWFREEDERLREEDEA